MVTTEDSARALQGGDLAEAELPGRLKPLAAAVYLTLRLLLG